MTYEGLLIDFGGVLTTSIFDSFAIFCAMEGLTPDAVRIAFRTNPEARQLLFDLEIGKLSEELFEPRLCAALGLSADRSAGLIDRLFGGMSPDEAMLAAVRAARRAGIRTGLISNSWGKGRYDPEQLDELFDGVVISAQEGMRKPDSEIYALGARRIGLDPRSCVFVDDLAGNLKPARELGMATVHHVDAATTIAQLEELLGVTLSA